MEAERRRPQNTAGAPAGNTLVIRSARDIYNFINNAPKTVGKGRLMVFTALASLLIDGWNLSGLSASVPSLVTTFHLSSTETGLLTSSIGVGAVVAALLGGDLVDRLGRLRSFLLDMALFVAAAIIGAFAPNFAVVVIARFFMGIGIGIDVPAAMSMVAEQTHSRKKRTLLNQEMVFFYSATISAYLISWLLVEFDGVGNSLWRWQMAISGVIALVVILLRLTIAEESAFWLASRGNLKSAADVIRKVYRITVTIDVRATSRIPVAARPMSVISLFRGRYLARTILATEINFLQSVVYFAVGFYLPVITEALFKSLSVSLLGTAAIQVAGLVGGTFAAIYANKVGFRRETLIGFAIEVPVLVIIGFGVAQGWLPITAGVLMLSVFLLVHTFGPAQTGVSIAALSYPTEMRGRGTGFSYGVGRVGSVVGLYIFPVLLAGVGLGHTVLVLSVVPLIGVVLTFFIKWDPTGATSETDDGAYKAQDSSAHDTSTGEEIGELS